MSSLSIGATGMSANQSVIDLIGQNITNASNPAYHQQEAILSELAYGNPTGAGVQVDQVQRLIDNALDAAVNGNSSALSSTTQQLQTLQQIQSVLDPSGTTNALDAQLQTFFNDLQQLSTQPDDATQRTVVVNDAQALANTLNSTAAQLDQTSTALTQQGQTLVGQVNQLASQIANVNGQIVAATASGASANALEDNRDGLIGQLAKLVDVRAMPQSNGVTNVLVGGAALVMGTQTTPIQMNVNANNQLVISQPGMTTPMTISGGTLGAVLTLRNQLVPQYQGQLDTFTTALVQAMDSIQATGLGLSGSLTSVMGQRGVTNTTVPLDQAGLALPPQEGTLDISVTDQATGQITNSQINIDPKTQSLQDVANAINAVPHLQAVVNSHNGTLSIVAQAGYSFDFAGQLSSTPDSQTITGTATPQISGSYTGSANDALTYTVTGSGQVGTSSDLNLQVTNSAGTLLGTFNIGQGYSPGSTAGTVDGVNVSMSAGTLNAGDSFTEKVTANPDTAGILTALGINTFFTGSDPSDVQVNSNLLNNPNLLATSATGEPGDATNLQRMIALQNQPVIGGTQTLSQYLAGFIGGVATQVNNLTTQQSAQQSVGQSLTTQQQAVSGVDPNEELVNLLQYQQGYQMSAEYISVVNQTVQYLFTLFS